MDILHTTSRMQDKAGAMHRLGKTIGLVPTMGYFHEGHLSLMREARKETDYVVVSLFVNPIQFGPHEDLDRYPRDMERDIALAQQAGVDAIFIPPADEMYPPGFRTAVAVEGLSNVLCGAHRPGHFQGVATVVCKLFNIVTPDVAYFGQKDAQQAIIIKRMVEDLNFTVRITVLPIVRETDGLAMSSRNAYLSERERQAALCLHRALQKAEESVRQGERNAQAIIAQAEAVIRSEPLAKVEYVAICDTEELSSIENITDEALLALAVRIGNTRLIDNAILKTG
ncbi:MAG: pantoate--beta-alanine ligase [bacterium]